MTKFGILLALMAPLTIAACTVQIVSPTGTQLPESGEVPVRVIAKPDPTPKPSALPTASPASPAPDTFTTADAYVERYEVVSAAAPGAPVSLKVHYGLSDPSWGFDKVTVEVDEAAKVIHVKPTMSRRNPRPDRPGMIVPAVIVENAATTEFTVKTPGTYTFSSPRYLSDPPKTQIVIGEAATQVMPLMTLMSHGGLCQYGGCSRTIEVLSDGTYTVATGDGKQTSGKLPADVLETLRREIEKADYAKLKSVPFTGTCPTAFDGSEMVYTFHTAAGPEKLPSCTFQLDDEAPLFQAVGKVQATIDPPPAP